LVAACGTEAAYHDLQHLLGDDGAEFMAVFGKLELLAPILDGVSDAYPAWVEASCGLAIVGERRFRDGG
jgi:hypothetical protein